ncbi:hypothetical protein [Vibrio nomapromontoriensis]|uniref:hypothetical protein n=1 Tax=Vibrio nomapromontoriensis TaxID=2910246 RepID=UPI003D0C4BCE
MIIRLFIVLILTSPTVVNATSTQSQLDQLAPEYRDWINDSCSKSLGPSLWRSCVNRNIDAIASNFPDKRLKDTERSRRNWINDSCSRSLGPNLWGSCVKRNLEAFDNDFPEDRLASLDSSTQAWVNDSCDRSLGPNLWSSCVTRNLRGIDRVAQQKEETVEKKVHKTSHSQRASNDTVTKWEVNTNNVAFLSISHNIFSGSGTALVAWPMNNGEVTVAYTTLSVNPEDLVCDESSETVHRIKEQAVRFTTHRVSETQCMETPKSSAGRKFVAEAFVNGRYVQWNKVQLSAIGFTSAMNKVTEGYNAL